MLALLKHLWNQTGEESDFQTINSGSHVLVGNVLSACLPWMKEAATAVCVATHTHNEGHYFVHVRLLEIFTLFLDKFWVLEAANSKIDLLKPFQIIV